jgi:chitinase
LNGEEVSFVTHGHNPDYKKPITEGCFDYLFIQLYNNNGFGLNSNAEITWNSEVDRQGNADFIYNSYNYIAKKYIDSTTFNLHIPTNTKICLGEPAGKTETASWYSPYRHIINGKSTAVSTPEEVIWANMKDQYDKCKSDFSSKQYAGIMTWSINEDFKNSNSFGFAKTMFSGTASYL